MTTEPLVWEFSEFHYDKDQFDEIQKLLDLNQGSIAKVFAVVKGQWPMEKAEDVVFFIENIKTRPSYYTFDKTTDYIKPL